LARSFYSSRFRKTPSATQCWRQSPINNPKRALSVGQTPPRPGTEYSDPLPLAVVDTLGIIERLRPKADF
jgi:hypothetical protein